MNSESCRQNTRIGAYVVGILGAFAVIGLLVWLMLSYTSGATPEQSRAAERMQILAQFQADNAPLLEKYDWQDQTRGVVRIPVDRAMDLTLQARQENGSAACRG